MEDGTLLRTEYKIKRPLSGPGLGQVTYFLNFGTPLITFERIEQSASSLVQRWRTGPPA